MTFGSSINTTIPWNHWKRQGQSKRWCMKISIISENKWTKYFVHTQQSLYATFTKNTTNVISVWRSSLDNVMTYGLQLLIDIPYHSSSCNLQNTQWEKKPLLRPYLFRTVFAWLSSSARVGTRRLRHLPPPGLEVWPRDNGAVASDGLVAAKGKWYVLKRRETNDV